MICYLTRLANLCILLYDIHLLLLWANLLCLQQPCWHMTHDTLLTCGVNRSWFIQYEPQRRDESQITVWESITNVFICPSPPSAWQLCRCWLSTPRAAPVSSSATCTTFSVSYSPFLRPMPTFGESTSPWSLYGWEHHLLSRCPHQQESWITSFKIFGVGSLISCSTYIFCSNLSAVRSPSQSTFLIHQKHRRLS